MEIKTNRVRYKAKELKVIHHELKAIETKQGLISPQAVVISAQSKSSPLHRYFEWNDTAAAAKYRLVQAGHLIRCVLIKTDHGDVRSFVNVRVETETEEGEESEYLQGYVSIGKTMKNTSLKEQVLTYAKEQLLLWRKKFGAYKEFYGICKEIDKLGS